MFCNFFALILGSEQKKKKLFKRKNEDDRETYLNMSFYSRSIKSRTFLCENVLKFEKIVHLGF